MRWAAPCMSAREQCATSSLQPPGRGERVGQLRNAQRRRPEGVLPAKGEVPGDRAARERTDGEFGDCVGRVGEGRLRSAAVRCRAIRRRFTTYPVIVVCAMEVLTPEAGPPFRKVNKQGNRTVPHATSGVRHKDCCLGNWTLRAQRSCGRIVLERLRQVFQLVGRPSCSAYHPPDVTPNCNKR